MLPTRKRLVAGARSPRQPRTRFHKTMLSKIMLSRTTMRNPTTTTNKMKTPWLLLLGFLPCLCCSPGWAQTKFAPPSPANRRPGTVVTPAATATPATTPATILGDGSEASTFSAVNNNITTILQDYQELTGKTVIEDSNLSANAVPITIMAPNPMPKEQLVRLIEAALLLNNYAFVPGPSA